jgi:hypothetical protein
MTVLGVSGSQARIRGVLEVQNATSALDLSLEYEQ